MSHGSGIPFIILPVLILLLGLLMEAVRGYGRTGKAEIALPILIVAAITVSIFMDMKIGAEDQPVSFLTIAVVGGDIFFYIWLHLQFVREHEQDLAAQQRIQIMMSQIQPHFLYNTLSTIQALCYVDPGKAGEMTEKFACYLRSNIDFLSLPELIPIGKELEHTKIYTDIEKTRFPSIQVDYDIRDTDFSVPPLTVQPVVENAIRHGVRIRDKGIVRVTIRKNEGFHEIIIEDSGKGFDVKKAEKTGGSHIGLANVRERIEKLCRGTLVIDSRIGEGTSVTIRIPAAAAQPREDLP